MKFFEEQEKARRKSRQLVALFILMLVILEATLNGMAYLAFASTKQVKQGYARDAYGNYGRSSRVVEGKAPAGKMPIWPFALVTFSSLAVVLGAAAVRASQLKSGGGAQVAEFAGGEEADGRDPLERRLLNVVEEMSLASGTPQPRVYVMRSEQGINAFAAGWSPEDAAICVTRGCLEGLSRDELQGVVAHEFSHIFNADMRINIRAMGMLFGLYALAIVGRELLDWGRFSNSEDNKIGKLVLVLGLGFLLLGWIGQVLGHILAAAISREREYLADASAVQFTRNPDGIGGALRKIGGAGMGKIVGSHVAEPKAMAMAHMFFGAGSMSLSGGMLATHPPLDDRIERVYGRQMEYLAPLRQSHEQALPEDGAQSADGSFDMAAKAAVIIGAMSTPAKPAKLTSKIDPSAALGFAGQDESPLKGIGKATRVACSDKARVGSLCLALVVASQKGALERLAAIESTEEAMRSDVARLVGELIDMDPSMHVALLDLCAGTLKGLGEAEKASILAKMTALAKLDGAISLREQALFQVAKRRMGTQMAAVGKGMLAANKDQASHALAWVARRSATSVEDAWERYQAGAKCMGMIALSQADWEASKKGEVQPLWSALDMLAPMQKPTLAKAVAAAAKGNDGGTDACRIACALMGCPAPFAEVQW